MSRPLPRPDALPASREEALAARRRNPSPARAPAGAARARPIRDTQGAPVGPRPEGPRPAGFGDGDEPGGFALRPSRGGLPRDPAPPAADRGRDGDRAGGRP